MKRSILALLLLPQLAFADDCTRYINGMWNGFPGDTYGAGHYFTVKGARVTARSDSGYTSYAMSPGYRNTLTQAEKARLDSFSITKTNAGNAMEGQFQDVFPGRPDAAIDLTTLRIFSTGSVQLILNRWGNAVSNLAALQCFPGHTNSTFVLSGQERSAGYGVNLWTFIITPNWIL